MDNRYINTPHFETVPPLLSGTTKGRVNADSILEKHKEWQEKISVYQSAYTNEKPLFQLYTPLAERLAKALEHVKKYEQGNDLLWPFMHFSMTIGELLNAAITNNPSSYRVTDLDERISAALIHAQNYKQIKNVLWEYQDFSLEIGEVLEAAKRKG